MASDIDIAQQAKLERIATIALDKLGISADHLEPYGHTKAKISLDYLESLGDRPDGKLILVTAMTPTPAGEGKTTTTVGLGDALNRIGKKAMICLREPSLGPVFGMKGGAAGGGHAQVVPMEDINLHFTGDFNAIALANNLLAALLDNHIHYAFEPALDTRRITWRRVMDMNDRALRDIVVGLGGVGNGYPREDGFDIVAASEVMAILCLSSSLADLKKRLGNIVVGYDARPQAGACARPQGAGAMTVLLKDALKPNLVQTLENNPAFIHGGPFANIAHGCNSVIATRSALKLADYVVTEAGFGADLGGEKFVDIKCRKAGLKPTASVVVATIRALKYHGGVDLKSLTREDLAALEKGLANLERHVENVQQHYGISGCRRDQPLLLRHRRRAGAGRIADGGEGSRRGGRLALGRRRHAAPKTWRTPSSPSATGCRAKASSSSTRTPIRCGRRSARSRARSTAPPRSPRTPKSASRSPACRKRATATIRSAWRRRSTPSRPIRSSAAHRTGHVLNVREVRLAAGAEFVVMICGDIMTMPGLPKVPSAHAIDITEDGKVVGLF